MRLLLPLALAASTAAFFFATPNAQACSCAPPPGADIAFEGAKFVFEGKAGTAVQATPDAEGRLSGFAPKTVTFEVLRSWKGGLSGTATVKTAGNSAACGRNYNEGESYLIYASANEEGEPYDTLCTRTRPSKGASEDFTVLDGLKTAPTTGGDTPTQTGDDTTAQTGGDTPAQTGDATQAGGDTQATDGGGDAAPDAGDATGDAGTADAGTDAPADAPADAPKDDAKGDEVAEGCSVVAAAPASAGLLLLAPVVATRRRRA